MYKRQPLPPAGTDPSFVIGGDVNVSAGSNASGNTIISPTSTVISYTMGNPNGSLLTGSPDVYKRQGKSRLICSGSSWNVSVFRPAPDRWLCSPIFA